MTPKRGLPVDAMVHFSATQATGKKQRSGAIKDCVVDFAPV